VLARMTYRTGIGGRGSKLATSASQLEIASATPQSGSQFVIAIACK
jgi:hypothetical protein